jgi:MazG family protein
MSEMERLREIMARLRGPDGCPWDREQTFASLATYLVEESYEALEAAESGSPAALKEELGDLLFQIVFQAQIADERGEFDIEALMKDAGDKIIRRHPHVFGEDRLSTADQVMTQWEQIKAEERRARRSGSLFSGVPARLPALLKALRLSTKAARVGFDWPDQAGTLAKVDEEILELRQALSARDRAAVEEELGDLLFTLANVARQEGIDPEKALQDANRKFTERFRYVEDRLRDEGLEPTPERRARMEELWTQAKAVLKKTSPVRTSPSGGTSGSGPPDARKGEGS